VSLQGSMNEIYGRDLIDQIHYVDVINHVPTTNVLPGQPIPSAGMRMKDCRKIQYHDRSRSSLFAFYEAFMYVTASFKQFGKYKVLLQEVRLGKTVELKNTMMVA
jgi:hypothetical protein